MAQRAGGPLHAASIEDELLADIALQAGLGVGFGIGREDVLIAEILAERVVWGFLFLASICETDLALEEEVITAVFGGCLSAVELAAAGGWPKEDALGVEGHVARVVHSLLIKII